MVVVLPVSLVLIFTRRHEATLEGLEKNSASHPGKPPLYIHISGCGILSDDARGELTEYVKEYTDTELDLKEYVFSVPMFGSPSCLSSALCTAVLRQTHTLIRISL